MAEVTRSVSPSTRTGTLGALVAAMAEVLASKGTAADVLREARDLLAAVHDMPRHWPTLEQATPVSAE